MVTKTTTKLVIFSDMKKAPKEFVEFFNKELKMRNAGVREAARIIGVSHPTISDIVTYGKAPSFDTCVAIAKAFNLPEENILRMAGLLKSKPRESMMIEEISFIFDSLPEQDREEILQIARMKLSLKERRRGAHEAGNHHTRLNNNSVEVGP